MIGVAIALFLTAAAVTFVRHETRLLGISQDRVDMIQGSRAAIDLIANDLRAAGQGIGYDEAGNFQGLLLGNFTAGGLNTWNGNGNSRSINLNDTTNKANIGNAWVSNVVDIGVLYAAGSYRTVNDWDPGGVLEYCARDDDGDGAMDMGTGFGVNDVQIIRADNGAAAETIQLAGIAGPQNCNTQVGDCLFDCYTAGWSLAPIQIFSTGVASEPSYVGGELAGGIQQVVYFVVANNNGFGALQRVVFTNNNCAAIDQNCGGTVATGVESLQMQIWQWQQTPPQWVNAGVGPINGMDRIRVDLELVVRADGTDERQHEAIALRLSPGNCAPMPCTTRDYTERRAYRTSVEIKNSGFMQIR
jgi:hypothetical protein